jgi:branched-chain amino acid transport system ATP-binding protein
VSLLRTEQLLKRFGEMHAVDNVDFVVEQGEVLSLIGSNGAGKTTLVNLISGLLSPDSGKIFLQEQDITSMGVYERIQAGIARSFQLVNLFDQLTALDNVALTIFSRQGKTRRLTTLAANDRAVTDEALAVLDAFGLQERWNIPAAGLAQGERKLLDVAVAYALRPHLLFLDEPTSGVSTRDKGRVMDTITSVVRSGHITAVIIEHDMDVVFTYSDRIVVMHEGAILAAGTPADIRANAAVATTLLGAPLPE